MPFHFGRPDEVVPKQGICCTRAEPQAIRRYQTPIVSIWHWLLVLFPTAIRGRFHLYPDTSVFIGEEQENNG
jgi:hypothetical protein